MSDPKTVLIVEDEKNIVDILRFNLQRAGYQTLEAYDGEDGLAQAVSANPDPVSYTHLFRRNRPFRIFLRRRWYISSGSLPHFPSLELVPTEKAFPSCWNG